MKAILTAAAALMAAPPVSANPNPDEAAVLAAVEAFTAAIAVKDAAAMKALVTEPGFLAVIEEREGPDRVSLVPMDKVVASLASIAVPVAEPLRNPVVRVDGPVASLRADFEFILDGKRSHCGVDIFTLIRVDGAWKIATLTYSHVTTGCGGSA